MLNDTGVTMHFLCQVECKVIFLGRKEKGMFGDWKRVKTFEKGNSKRKKMSLPR